MSKGRSTADLGPHHGLRLGVRVKDCGFIRWRQLDGRGLSCLQVTGLTIASIAVFDHPAFRASILGVRPFAQGARPITTR